MKKEILALVFTATFAFASENETSPLMTLVAEKANLNKAGKIAGIGIAYNKSRAKAMEYADFHAKIDIASELQATVEALVKKSKEEGGLDVDSILTSSSKIDEDTLDIVYMNSSIEKTIVQKKNGENAAYFLVSLNKNSRIQEEGVAPDTLSARMSSRYFARKRAAKKANFDFNKLLTTKIVYMDNGSEKEYFTFLYECKKEAYFYGFDFLSEKISTNANGLVEVKTEFKMQSQKEIRKGYDACTDKYSDGKDFSKAERDDVWNQN
ncbi:hypothetical protein [Fibrobacter sp.]|uniref:hypothetical protein n=1 Tax=Fibrobacter sp. TaxID=35828 RepID=UPI0038906600